ncbi:MAG: DUF2252 family protein [Acidimicrobiia bacterium]
MVDVARKVVGVGSVGTHCAVLLLMDSDDAPLPADEGGGGRRARALHPDRAIRRTTANGSCAGNGSCRPRRRVPRRLDPTCADRDFYVRQLRDMKGSAALERFTPEGLADNALCGWALGRAHAAPGDPVAISAYLGSGRQFVGAIVEFAHDYADQTEARPRRAGTGGGRRPRSRR